MAGCTSTCAAPTPVRRPPYAGQALAALLRDLGVPSGAVPEHPDAASALLRSLLAPTRTLLVLDDAVSAAQVRPLLPVEPGCGASPPAGRPSPPSTAPPASRSRR
ncbi:hypothetical protein SALBM217S_01763 [Streptomyces griseoloalbus]